MRFFGHLVVQIASKHPYCRIRINVHVKTVPSMYITWGLRKKKFWCSVLRAHNRAPFAHNCIHRSVQRSGRPKNQPKSILLHGHRWLTIFSSSPFGEKMLCSSLNALVVLNENIQYSGCLSGHFRLEGGFPLSSLKK